MSVDVSPMIESRDDRQRKTVSMIKGKNKGNYNVRLRDDKYDCFVTDIAVTVDGRRLLVDRYNCKVKMFSSEMKIKSSLSLPAQPWDITVIGTREALISVPDEPKLLILKVCKKEMSIRGIINLSFKVFGIATYKDKLLVTCRFPTPSVKLVDQSGKVYWSTSTNHQGQILFSRPEYLIWYDDGTSSTVIVTDFEKSMFTLLDSNTGDFIRRHQVKKKVLCCTTTDTAGNIYACYYETKELGVLSKDFSKEQIFLTVHDGVSLCPQAVAYDAEGHQLLVSYYGNDFDYFQLPTNTWIKYSKKYNVKQQDDGNDCFIKGVAITQDGRRLLTDWKKIKMFSWDMKIISYLSLPAKPWDIAVNGNKKAVVSVFGEPKFFILYVSDKHMSLLRTVKLTFVVRGIAKYKNKFVVTSLATSPPSVNLIDQNGKVYWSTSTDQKGQKLLSRPEYVTCYDDGRSSTVIVTDNGNDTVTQLNSDTGYVIRRRQVEGKWPRGVTTDTAGNVYVCYYWTSEVAVLFKDLSEEKFLLTQRDGISGNPLGISYDASDHRLLVTYSCLSSSCNAVDSFQLQWPPRFFCHRKPP